MNSERKGFFQENAVPKAALITLSVLVLTGFSIGLINETIVLAG